MISKKKKEQEKQQELATRRYMRSMYLKFFKISETKSAEWKNFQTKGEKDWGIAIPELPKEITNPKFSFDDPDKALYQIARAIKRLQNLNFASEYLKWENKERSKWINEIVSKAPENCQLIVIRSNYTPYYDENKEKFEEGVENKATSAIRDWTGRAMWIAVNPKDDPTNWNLGMTSKNSTVEYIY